MKRMSLLMAGLLLVAVATGCMAPEESSALNAINGDRAANGMAGLGEHGDLINKAQAWAVHLATNSGGQCSMGTLVHSILQDGAPGGWQRLGENVGCRIAPGDYASQVAPLQAAFMASQHHRENILDGRFNKAGVGMAAVPSTSNPGMMAVYEVQEFARA
jgi:uncharacterized protein YkwD